MKFQTRIEEKTGNTQRVQRAPADPKSQKDNGGTVEKIPEMYKDLEVCQEQTNNDRRNARTGSERCPLKELRAE